jgi:hypothetical protein
MNIIRIFGFSGKFCSLHGLWFGAPTCNILEVRTECDQADPKDNTHFRNYQSNIVLLPRRFNQRGFCQRESLTRRMYFRVYKINFFSIRGWLFEFFKMFCWDILHNFLIVTLELLPKSENVYDIFCIVGYYSSVLSSHWLLEKIYLKVAFWK